MTRDLPTKIDRPNKFERSMTRSGSAKTETPNRVGPRPPKKMNPRLLVRGYLPLIQLVSSFVTYFQTSIRVHDQIEKTRISFCGGDWIFFQPLDGDFTHSNIILWIKNPFHTCTFKLHLRSVRFFRTVSSTRLVFIIDLSYFLWPHWQWCLVALERHKMTHLCHQVTKSCNNCILNFKSRLKCPKTTHVALIKYKL